MSRYDFIFSNQRYHRLLRHLAFWVVFLLYFYYINLEPKTADDLWRSKTYMKAFQLMIFTPVSVLSVYVSIYFLLPQFILKGRYLRLVLAIVFLSTVYLSLAWLLTVALASLTQQAAFHQLPVTFRWFLPVRYGLGLPLAAGAITTIIKLLKYWHQKQKENEVLQTQKINTGLQLLKTQIQPQFLYDSLENIHRLLKSHSHRSMQALLNFSDLLSYLLYENQKELVPLEKEWQVVRTYLQLKEAFYEDHFTIEIIEEITIKDIWVAPMSLLALVENCFERLTDISARNRNISLHIKTIDSELFFTIEYSRNKKVETEDDKEQGHWLKPIKRIQMLYPNKHSFEIFSENGSITVQLILEIEKTTATPKEKYLMA